MSSNDQQQQLRDLTLATARLLRFHGDLGLTYPQAEADLFKDTVRHKLAARSNVPPRIKPAPPIAKYPAAPTKAENKQAMADLQEQVHNCSACPRHNNGSALFGDGKMTTPVALMVITDPPQIHPQHPPQVFQGEADALFTRMLSAINLQRDQIFCTNICKCPGATNSPPTTNDLKCCLQHLHQQLTAFRPQVLLSMGTIVSQALLGREHQLAALRGRFHTYQNIPLVATYHPDLLRQYPNLKKGAWYDLQLIQKRL